MDAVTAITNDHRLFERLFEQLRSGQGDRMAMLAEVKARLVAHSLAEEQHVYPELLRNKPDEADDVHHGVAEHREAETKLAEVEAADPASPDFDTKLAAFVKAVLHHVEEEESEILQDLQKALPADELERLGQLFEQRRIAELELFGIDQR